MDTHGTNRSSELLEQNITLPHTISVCPHRTLRSKSIVEIRLKQYLAYHQVRFNSKCCRLCWSCQTGELELYHPLSIGAYISLDGGVEVPQLDGSLGVLREKLSAVLAPRGAELHNCELGLDEFVDGVLGQNAHLAVFRFLERRRRGLFGGRPEWGRCTRLMIGWQTNEETLWLP